MKNIPETKIFHRKRSTGPSQFGTIGGVFTPDVVTILGVIMYLRLGWVVGNAGFLGEERKREREKVSLYYMWYSIRVSMR